MHPQPAFCSVWCSLLSTSAYRCPPSRLSDSPILLRWVAKSSSEHAGARNRHPAYYLNMLCSLSHAGKGAAAANLCAKAKFPGFLTTLETILAPTIATTFTENGWQGVQETIFGGDAFAGFLQTA